MTARPPIDAKKYLPKVYGKRPRIDQAHEWAGAAADGTHTEEPLPSIDDTHAAFLLARSEFPPALAAQRVPPIVLKHQLNTLVQSASVVDRSLDQLRRTHIIVVVNTGTGRNELGLLDFADYCKHTSDWAASSNDGPLATRFLAILSHLPPALSYDKAAIMKALACKEDTVSKLIRLGVLTRRDETSLWLALPNMGVFVSNLIDGRKEIKKMLTRSKFKELLKSTLLSRELRSTCLGVKYLVADLLGSEVICASPSSSGDILRIKSND
jgi:hypothetical protein